MSPETVQTPAVIDENATARPEEDVAETAKDPSDSRRSRRAPNAIDCSPFFTVSVKGWKAWHEQNPADDASNDEKKAA
jgi:hypothetical protein